MHRAILEACLPWLGLMAAAGIVLVLLTRLAGARVQFGRLVEIHRNEEGAAQTFAFTATLPFFVFLMVLVLQLVQLMIGTVVVHYAAFAAARAALVWIPARTASDTETENCISARTLETGAPAIDAPGAGGVTYVIDTNMEQTAAQQSPKVEKVFLAAMLACMPISPSAALPTGASPTLQGEIDKLTSTYLGPLTSTYLGIAESLSGNPKSPQRLRNKFNWAAGHTRLEMRCYHQNERPDVALLEGVSNYDPVARILPSGSYWDPNLMHWVPGGYTYYWRPFGEFKPNELGWQDTITVTVHHDMVLFGSSWPLSAMIAATPLSPTSVYGPVGRVGNVTACTLSAQATLGVEGEKSSIPYVSY